MEDTFGNKDLWLSAGFQRLMGQRSHGLFLPHDLDESINASRDLIYDILNNILTGNKIAVLCFNTV